MFSKLIKVGSQKLPLHLTMVRDAVVVVWGSLD